jgi:SET domain-containing protein
MTLEISDVVDNLTFTVIKPSKIHGFGLFATKFIGEGTSLGTLDGQIISERLHNKFELTFEWNAIEKDTLLVRPYRTKYSYINHHRTPNLLLVGFPIVVTALHDIQEGQELTLDYRKESLSETYIETTGKYYL